MSASERGGRSGGGAGPTTRGEWIRVGLWGAGVEGICREAGTRRRVFGVRGAWYSQWGTLLLLRLGRGFPAVQPSNSQASTGYPARNSLENFKLAS